jgi:apolipoprotein N-acyltransferase
MLLKFKNGKKLTNIKHVKFFRPYLLTLILPTLWLLADYLRGHSFPSFPWVLTGYAYQASDLFMSITQLSMFVPLVGVYGFGFVLYVLMGCLLATYQSFTQNRTLLAWRALFFIMLMLSFSWVLYAFAQPAAHLPQPHLFTQQTKHKLSLALVQDYVKSNETFRKKGMSDQETQEIYESYIDLIKSTPADLLVLPETTLPLPWSQTPEHLKQALITQKKSRCVITWQCDDADRHKSSQSNISLKHRHHSLFSFD